MSELDDVLAALAGSNGEGMALATVVAAGGSTYRRAGARLVGAGAGELVGNISGVCLEGDVVQAAAEVQASGQPRLLHFDLTADDEVVWGWGLGCNGVIEVLVEPASSALGSVAALQAARREHRSLALVTLLDGPRLGARLVVHPEGHTEGALGSSDQDRDAAEAALKTLTAGASATVILPSGDRRAFVEVFHPPLRLLVCGVGHDAIPLVAAGAGLGWRVEGDRQPARLPRRQPLPRGAAPGGGRAGRRRHSRRDRCEDSRRGHEPQLPPRPGLPAVVPQPRGGLPGHARAPGPARAAPRRAGRRGCRARPGSARPGVRSGRPRHRCRRSRGDRLVDRGRDPRRVAPGPGPGSFGPAAVSIHRSAATDTFATTAS